MLAAAIGIYDPNDGIQDLKDISQAQAAINLEKIKKVVDKKLRFDIWRPLGILKPSNLKVRGISGHIFLVIAMTNT